MKMSEALRRTRAKLWDGKAIDRATTGKEEFCCLAAREAGSGVGKLVIPLLGALLGGKSMLEDWLAANHPGPRYDANILKMQATRKAWLNHLIAHYKSIGD